MADEGRWRDQERYRYREHDRPRYGESRPEDVDFARPRRGYGDEAYEASYGEPRRGEYSREYGEDPYRGYRREGYGYGGWAREGEGEYPRGGYGGYAREGRGYGQRGYDEYGRERYGGYGREGYGGYGRELYGGQEGGGYGYQRGGYRGGEERGYGGREERGWWDRATDEVSSWFGDEEAERRRRLDEWREGRHRGRGPKGYARSDDRIREDVCDRLSDHPVVDASDVEVQVSNCEVTLTGTVDSREERRRAEECAERVSGVSHVQNNLRVKQRTTGGSGMSSGRMAAGTTGGSTTASGTTPTATTTAGRTTQP
jgi:osmotically-inducible protein OsmY